MKSNICVGAAEAESGRALRLIPRDRSEYHSWPDFDAPIGSVVTLRGSRAVRVEPPHTEDFLVSAWERSGAIDDLAAWISGRCVVWSGDRRCLFEGLVAFTPRGKGRVERGARLPSASVGFWELPAPMRLQSSDRQRYTLGGPLPVDVPYVGIGAAPGVLRAGTLVRLSLSRWWAPADGSMQEACWLQLSGVIEG